MADNPVPDLSSFEHRFSEMVDRGSSCRVNRYTLTRSLEKLLKDAHLCGELNLSGQKLKEFPKSNKYDLSDTTTADLSNNFFTSFPIEIIKFWSLESLNLYHNAIRSVPNTITSLQLLVYLDLSRNRLTHFTPAICQLPLEILLLSNNKIKQLPNEIGFCKTLIELDVSCNNLIYLPSELGRLPALKSLNAKNNCLIELPLELTYIKLAKLDVSINQIASLPVELRLMSALESLDVDNNPLISPPTSICMKGRIHIFKWLELKSLKDFRNQSSSWKFNSLKSNNQSVYSNVDSLTLSEPASIVHSSDEGTNDTIDFTNKSEKIFKENFSPEMLQLIKHNGTSNKLEINLIKPEDITHHHTESYREYKESLKKQRTQESIYKGKNQNNNNIDQKNKSTEIIPPSVNDLSTLPNFSLDGWIKNNTQHNKNKFQFTMKRECVRAKEESLLLKQLKNTIESRLKMSLPSELSPALSDGVVLCYLVNHVKPGSVAIIHVPSSSVPKLTMARCRRNVDNFLEACRNIGVNENMICCAVDILEGKHIIQVAITVAELIKLQNVQLPSLVNE